MVKNKVVSESTRISELIIYGMQEKKGNEIVRLDLRNIQNSVADYYVICHAESSTQVKSIASGIEEEVFKALKLDPHRKEGIEYGEWILLDYIDVMVHVFKTEKRHYYGIEDLWGDAEIKMFKSA